MELNQSMESLMTADTRSWTKRLTNLEKCLMIIISFGTCVIIACLLNIAIRDDYQNVPCTSRSCIKKASEILKQIDEDVDPCTDFFQFSCGKLIDTTHDKQAPYKVLRNQIEKQLHVLSEPIDSNDHPIINYQKKLFKACINETEGDTSFETFKQILKEINGWPVVDGDAWNEHNFDLVDAIGKLRRNGLEFTSILTISLSKVSLPKKQKIIKVNFPYFSRMYDYLYSKFMVDVAVIFGANKTRALVEMEEVYEFIVNMEKFRDEHPGFSDSELHEVTYDKFQDLLKQFPGINWVKLINAILAPVTKIDSQDVVIFPNSKFMQGYLNFVNKTPKRVLSNYITWYVIEDLLPLLSTNLQNVHNDYKCLSGIPRRSPHDLCKLAIKRNFGPIPAYLAYAKKHLTKEVKEKGEDIFKRVKYEFSDLLRKLPINVKDQNKLERTFDNLEAIIGIKENRVDNALFDKFFKGDLELVEDRGFLRTYLHFKWKVENIWIENVHITNISISDLLIYYQIPRTATMYILEEHAIAVPVGMLHNLFYEGDKSMLSHFATLGKNIGTALASIFNDLDIRGENGSDIWSTIIEAKCDDPFNKDDILEYNYDKIRTSEQIGLKTAYSAYRKWANENDEKYSILGVHYNPNQLFWISSMSDLCFEDEPYIATLHKHNLGVRQNPDFVNDFHCGSNSKMSKSGKCDVF